MSQINAAQMQERNDFADTVGLVHGLKIKDLDFEAFRKVFTAKYPREDASEYELLYQAGYTRGLEKAQFALSHGAKRAPSVPPSLLVEDFGSIPHQILAAAKLI